MKGQRSQKAAVVIFAHVPPPMHGQSYMVQLLLGGLRERDDLRVAHVDARFSASSGDIGSAGLKKVFLALRYSLRAIQARFRHRADILYYVPAPAKRAALYRDWIVMALCRPFFRRVVLHWHAVGLGEWTETRASFLERTITKSLLGRADLSIVLSDFARADAEMLRPREIAVIANGIPDPCPQFDRALRDSQKRRIGARAAALQGRSGSDPATFTVLFLASCTAEKGLFATLDALMLLKETLAPDTSELRLIIAGEFPSSAERVHFEQRLKQPALRSRDAQSLVEYVGFADALTKRRLFEAADCLCFPSLYPHEGQPVAIIEALAYDLPVVATRWRGIPEMLSGTTSRLIDNQNPREVANALHAAMLLDAGGENRRQFLARFELGAFARAAGDALLALN